MVTRRGEDPRPLPSETALRAIMRGLRQIMSEDAPDQNKLRGDAAGKYHAASIRARGDELSSLFGARNGRHGER